VPLGGEFGMGDRKRLLQPFTFPAWFWHWRTSPGAAAICPQLPRRLGTANCASGPFLTSTEAESDARTLRVVLWLQLARGRAARPFYRAAGVQGQRVQGSGRLGRRRGGLNECQHGGPHVRRQVGPSGDNASQVCVSGNRTLVCCQIDPRI
jgi:hypothetical protein